MKVVIKPFQINFQVNNVIFQGTYSFFKLEIIYTPSQRRDEINTRWRSCARCSQYLTSQPVNRWLSLTHGDL